MGTLATTALAITLAAVSPTAATSCAPAATEPAGTGAVVVATGFERNGAGDPGTHYAECTTPAGDRYRVKVSAAKEYSLNNGDTCPSGPRLPMPDPGMVRDLQKELEKPLPYEGGNPDGPCGAWGTVDKDEARKMFATCPPLARGDLG